MIREKKVELLIQKGIRIVPYERMPGDRFRIKAIKHEDKVYHYTKCSPDQTAAGMLVDLIFDEIIMEVKDNE